MTRLELPKDGCINTEIKTFPQSISSLHTNANPTTLHLLCVHLRDSQELLWPLVPLTLDCNI
ncbi:hypothetical protein E2C01_047009 [Portunus trituberculatus]|uniref:Uncharacterized protein n=1 Tax=Portunus trituberculatus TaxID=210409 RepID=A0A5B7G6S2_PORTR|nr:hypothetical protein [Portunus trituberculatus]